ncbi:MAG: DNA repair protein RadC [Methylacidiphilales bacterium]|nr:DNA repair protein RadC [Candidatus Methylacidiphilales bacterium]
MNTRYYISSKEIESQVKEVGCEMMTTVDLLGFALYPRKTFFVRQRLAKKLLSKTQNDLSYFFSTNSAEFQKNTGLDNSIYFSFRAVRELLERALCQELTEREALSSSEKTRRLLSSKLRFYKVEVFVCLYLNSQYQLLEFEQHAKGTVHGTFVHPREIVKRALELGSSAVIIAHNHPSGEVEPSKADITITKQIHEALKLVEITLLDHMLIGGNKVVSFAEQNLF